MPIFSFGKNQISCLFTLGFCLGRHGKKRVVSIFLLLLLVLCQMSAQASTFSKKTALQTLSHPLTRALFAKNPDNLVFEPTGQTPPALRVLKDGSLLGYLFSTYAVSGSLGFSGKPIDIHIGLSPDGHIIGTRIVRHQEPILVLGISSRVLEDYVAGFQGLDIAASLNVGDKNSSLPDIVSGATVSSGVIRDTIIRSARQIALSYGLSSGKKTEAHIDRSTYHYKNWFTLLKEKSVVFRKITMGEVNKAFGNVSNNALVSRDPNGTFIDLYMALLTPPDIGQNLLKPLKYNNLMGKAGMRDHLIMIAANGFYSFRGRNWRRSGIFDRIEIVQGSQSFKLTKKGYQLLDRIHAIGTPALREVAVYTLSEKAGFNPIHPFRLRLRVQRSSEDIIAQTKLFDLSYKLPNSYIIASKKTKSFLDEPSKLWQQFWWSQKFSIIFLVNMLMVLTGILFFQDSLTSRKDLYLKVRKIFLLTTVLFIGLYAGAQLSVLNVLTFIHSLMNGFSWDLFLLNPLVFILWSFVGVALLFWGRGVYCGWLCPFGALQELLNGVARKMNIRQIKIPWLLNERLWPIKYIFFLGLLSLSLSSMNWTVWLAEVEPFKTVIILKFWRSWPFVFYALLVLAAGLFIERFYCRYLCPLGAALAIPARLHMFEWLKRRHQCGHGCNICAANCTVQAIHPMGQINPNECVYCLRCQSTYHDSSVCHALRERAKRREKF